MEFPSLRLTVEKGPRQGETFECKAAAVARVGRIIKGNHLAVRDPGVSQKHLTFQFQREASSWCVSDLDTSNGTLVNGFQIPPSSPFPVSDGDTIKIGEFTVISVKVLAPEGRRVGDFCDEEEERSEVGRKRRRGARKGVPSLPVVEELVADVTNGNKDRKGRGRRSKKGTSASASVNKDEDVVAEQIVEVEVPLAKPRTRGRRPAARSASIPSKDEKEVVKRSDSKDVEAEEAVEAEKVVVVVEGDITEPTASAGEREELAKEEEEEEEEEEVDLDKMTLGQWFARMEKILPLMINDMAEEAIANLKETARRFDEFIEMSSTSQQVQI